MKSQDQDGFQLRGSLFVLAGPQQDPVALVYRFLAVVDAYDALHEVLRHPDVETFVAKHEGVDSRLAQRPEIRASERLPFARFHKGFYLVHVVRHNQPLYTEGEDLSRGKTMSDNLRVCLLE